MIFWAQGKTTNKELKSKVIYCVDSKVFGVFSGANFSKFEKGNLLERGAPIQKVKDFPSCFPLRSLCDLVICKASLRQFAEILKADFRPFSSIFVFVLNFSVVPQKHSQFCISIALKVSPLLLRESVPEKVKDVPPSAAIASHSVCMKLLSVAGPHVDAALSFLFKFFML